MSRGPAGHTRKAPRSARVATVVVGLACAAPVPGDIGACGQPVQILDAPTFFAARKTVDCRRCGECSLTGPACIDACDAAVPADVSFPDRCLPLVHDGEVCLRALIHASCEQYAGYVSSTPLVPTECEFCPGGPP